MARLKCEFRMKNSCPYIVSTTDFICHISLPSTIPVLVALTTTELASAQSIVQPILKFWFMYKWIVHICCNISKQCAMDAFQLPLSAAPDESVNDWWIEIKGI